MKCISDSTHTKTQDVSRQTDCFPATKKTADLLKNHFILKGDICFSKTKEELQTEASGYVVCADGICQGVYGRIPERFRHLPVLDCSGHLIVPGLTDLHVHAPQYAFRGMGMDMELLDWLNNYTFPEETRYEDLSYAEEAYKCFTRDLFYGPNTRASIFGTRHVPATLLLMEQLEQTGLQTRVGKVNMDRNCDRPLCEQDAPSSLADTRRWLEKAADFKNCRPILTPRFIPSCSDTLMRGLREIQTETQLPVQSHLSENLSEIEWVQSLCPESSFYGDAYQQFGLFGGENCPTIMAHCVHSSPEEIALLKKQQVWVAHCPQSNTNLASGIAPIRTYLDQGLRIGLGSDVAAGTKGSIFQAMADAIQVSKLYWRLADTDAKPLTTPEAFWLGTVGGGSFFGNVGAFLPGFEFDALILKENRFPKAQNLTLPQRLERFLYLGEDPDILHKFAAGVQLF